MDNTQILKDITYRLNGMRAWELMIFVKEHYKSQNEKAEFKSAYDESHVLEPALEISIIFGRQLLDFLRINLNKKTDKLCDNLTSRKNWEQDDVFITDLYPNVNPRPFNHSLTTANTDHLERLIKVANKAVAHLTTKGTTKEEFASIEIARPVIYDLVRYYVPILDPDKIWWTKKDEQRNAIMLKG